MWTCKCKCSNEAIHKSFEILMDAQNRIVNDSTLSNPNLEIGLTIIDHIVDYLVLSHERDIPSEFMM